MIAKIFQILGIVVLFITIVAAAILLPLISKLLKKLNKTIQERESGLGKQMDSSISSIDSVSTYIETLDSITTSARDFMDSILSFTEKALAFLESRTFQVGVSILTWCLFFFVALPRALFMRTKKAKRKMVLPPSWEKKS
ncbi:MAG: hypothetical protein PHP64_05535 [Actinomycetota bacterium]|nr:hypothetical protein [Actinomycetota bacterium]